MEMECSGGDGKATAIQTGSIQLEQDRAGSATRLQGIPSIQCDIVATRFGVAIHLQGFRANYRWIHTVDSGAGAFH